jgi:hypothetical protein
MIVTEEPTLPEARDTLISVIKARGEALDRADRYQRCSVANPRLLLQPRDERSFSLGMILGLLGTPPARLLCIIGLGNLRSRRSI